MSAKKTSPDQPARSEAKAPARWVRWSWVIAVVVGLAVGLGYLVWRQVREHVLTGDQYQVDPQKIAVTAPPPWIRSDVKAEAMHDAGLGVSLSLLDPRLTVRMASAFAAHPWVARVERVSKHFPSSVEVVLAYRQPVGMVEVRGGALPVDADAVVLPSADFAPQQAERYPRIAEIYTTPGGAIGTRWADPAVVGAARIAAILGDDWQRFGLDRIVPGERKPARSGFEYEFVLYTRRGTRIDWGRAPSSDASGESSYLNKLAQLRQLVAQRGSLDSAEGPQQLRFSESGQLQAERRAPLEALPKNPRRPE